MNSTPDLETQVDTDRGQTPAPGKTGRGSRPFPETQGVLRGPTFILSVEFGTPLRSRVRGPSDVHTTGASNWRRGSRDDGRIVETGLVHLPTGFVST